MKEAIQAGDFGWLAYHRNLPKRMRRKQPCRHCPFIDLTFLRPGRLADVKFALSIGRPFWCHETVYAPGIELVTDPETGEEARPDFDRSYRMCEGAALWLEERIAEEATTLNVIAEQLAATLQLLLKDTGSPARANLGLLHRRYKSPEPGDACRLLESNRAAAADACRERGINLLDYEQEDPDRPAVVTVAYLTEAATDAR